MFKTRIQKLVTALKNGKIIICVESTLAELEQIDSCVFDGSCVASAVSINIYEEKGRFACWYLDENKPTDLRALNDKPDCYLKVTNQGIMAIDIINAI